MEDFLSASSLNTVMLQSCLNNYRALVSSTALYERQLARAQEILNAETGSVAMGISSRQEAVRRAVQQFAVAGLTGFVDKAGHHWSPEAYANMDIRTTCGNVARQAVFARNQDYGNDLVLVSILGMAREKCYPWQGKVIAMSTPDRDVEDGEGGKVHAYNVGGTSYGQPDGLWGINCHHQPTPFIPGWTIPHGDVPDKATNDARYAESQQQRQLERDIRYAKREAAMMDAAGDKEGFEKAAVKVRRANERQAAFLKSTGRTGRSDRTQVNGYGRSVSAKATAAVKHEERFQKFFHSIQINQPKRDNAEALRQYVRQAGTQSGKLRVSDQRIMDAIPRRFDWVQVKPSEADFYTLAALTAKTGDEYAMFAKGDTKIIIHGKSADGRAWSIPESLARKIFDEQLRWTAHSHPTTLNVNPSDADRKTLEGFTWQDKSSIIDLKGRVKKFTVDRFRDLERR